MNGISRFLFVSILAVVLTACSSGRSPDNTLPVVTLTGDNPQILAFGEAYTELGATASDNRDGDATASIVIDAGGVDTATPGDYTVTYNVTDAAGNAATVTRTVTVQPPVPEQAEASVTGDIKQLVFNWNEVQFTDYYRLMENPDGHSGFTQLGEDIPADTRTATQDIAVHLFDWYESQYLIEACNVTGCSTSDVVTVTDAMLDTIGYFKASNTDAGDGFAAVALSADGNTLAVGAGGEDSCATGMNGDETNNSCENSGAVYLFRLREDGWNQLAYIKASNTDTGDFFGTVALSADGNTLAVGARRKNSCAIGVNGDHDDNSCENSGAVYVFRYEDDAWRQRDYFKTSITDMIVRGFGRAVALSATGDLLAVVSGAGLHMIHFDGEMWQEHTFFPFDNDPVWGGNGFSGGLAMNAEGNVVAVSFQGDCGTYGYCGYWGSVDVFRLEVDIWNRHPDVWKARDWDGAVVPVSLALSADGDLMAIGVENNYWGPDGFVAMLRADEQDWTDLGYIAGGSCCFGEAPDHFGQGIALSADGETVAVNAFTEDSASTGVNGDQASNFALNSGAVYVLQSDENGRYQQAYIKASNTQAEDWFGTLALSADGNTLAVGAGGEDSCATGVNGDQDDNTCEGAGAVYVY